jgi:hypothetical protein
MQLSTKSTIIFDLVLGENKKVSELVYVIFMQYGGNVGNDVHTPKFLKTITILGLSNLQLKLKVGVLVMLLRNIDNNNKDEKICA